MAREYNASITFDDAHYMVDNEGYTQLETNMPTGTECMTRAAIEWFLDTNKEKFSDCAMNQLVPYHLLEPKTVLAWRAINEYCVQEDIPVTLEMSSTRITTTGGSDGTATVRVTSGAPNFDYSWDNGSTTNNSSSNTNTISNLTVGTYTVTVTSADGIVATGSVEITDKKLIKLSVGTDAGDTVCLETAIIHEALYSGDLEVGTIIDVPINGTDDYFKIIDISGDDYEYVGYRIHINSSKEVLSIGTCNSQYFIDVTPKVGTIDNGYLLTYSTSIPITHIYLFAINGTVVWDYNVDGLYQGIIDTSVLASGYYYLRFNKNDGSAYNLQIGRD